MVKGLVYRARSSGSSIPAEESAETRQGRIRGTFQLVVVAVVACSIFKHAWRATLAEDAYILLRYALHLATGHGIVWNPGEHPVEGATSFLHLAAVAGAIRLGLAPELAAKLVGGAATVAAAALLAARLPRLGVDRWTATAAGCALACSPVASLAMMGFDTPLGVLFSTCVALSLHGVLLSHSAHVSGLPRRLAGSHTGRSRQALAGHWSLPLACLLLCLSRPDAVFIAVPALLVAATAGEVQPLALNSVRFFVLPGLAYFAWRCHYFGYPFPNTFYVKHEGRWLHLDTFKSGLHGILFLAAPFLAIISRWATKGTNTAILALKLCVPWVVFLAAFLLIRDEQNVMHRFQMLAFPWILTSFAVAWTRIDPPALPDRAREGAQGSARRRALWPAVASTTSLAFFAFYPVYEVRPVSLRPPASTYAASQVLARYRSQPHAMMVTEAGVLPFLSGWRTLDAHGLNDPQVAHHGLTRPYVDAFHPDVIEFHVYSARYQADRPWMPSWIPYSRAWDRTTKWIYLYAVERGYRLAAICRWYADSDDYDWYFVRPDCLDAGQIAHRLAHMPGVLYSRSQLTSGRLAP